jgi:signal transduction histidine kinase
VTRQQRAIAFFVTLCVLLVSAAVSLIVFWVYTTATTGTRVAPVIVGIVIFALIIAGLIVYTVFLVLAIRRNEEHDSFINSVTHELKTPIASIRLYLETLKARNVSDVQRRQFYDIMLADADRLHHTVDQVLEAGIAREKPQRQQTAVDMTQVSRECVELALVRHHLGPETIHLDALAGSLLVRGDAEKLRTVVTNLLNNAVKYSGDDVRVTVSVAAPAPGTVWVRVQDHGVGIPKKQLKRIFKRFHRVQMRGLKVGGTGLGLYIVRAIARAHGGRVFAHSEGEGHGATFTVELPRLHAEPEALRPGA